MTPRNTILQGDAHMRLQQLASASVDCVVTSPPYFQLRNYAMDGQLGLEATVTDWVDGLRHVFAEVARVLKPTGVVFLNLGDSYSRHRRYGAPPKCLLLGPEQLVLALAHDGYIVRNKIIWAKTNPMPSSVGDRLSTTYDVVYLLVRSRHYAFDLDAIRVPHQTSRGRRPRNAPNRPKGWAGPLAGSHAGLLRARPDGQPGHLLGKNPGDVWFLPASSYRGAHFATFPEVLVERMIRAGCPEATCGKCGEPWRRPAEVERIGPRGTALPRDPHIRRYPTRWTTLRRVGELAPTCACGAVALPGLVLDPFLGSGTTAAVARRLGRDYLGIELNPAYIELAEARLKSTAPNPATEAA